MSDGRSNLDRRAVDLLLDIVELPDPALSGAALEDFFCGTAEPLLSSGLLKPAGYEAVSASLADHDDVPVTLSWSAEARGYGYFSPTAGWVTVPGDRITRYRADMPTVIAAVFALRGTSRRTEPFALAPELLWEIGELRLGRRTHRVPIWFGRRLHDPAVWRQIKDVAKNRPAPRQRVLLTSTPPQRLPKDIVAGHVLVSLRDVIGVDTGLSLNPEILAARLDRPPANEDKAPIVVIADGREVRLLGQVFRFPKGVNQRRIICLLFERYLQGQYWVSSDEIVTELDLRDGARIRDFFKKSPAWGHLLIEHGGMCGFCLAADLAGPAD